MYNIIKKSVPQTTISVLVCSSLKPKLSVWPIVVRHVQSIFLNYALAEQTIIPKLQLDTCPVVARSLSLNHLPRVVSRPVASLETRLCRAHPTPVQLATDQPNSITTARHRYHSTATTNVPPFHRHTLFALALAHKSYNNRRHLWREPTTRTSQPPRNWPKQCLFVYKQIPAARAHTRSSAAAPTRLT